MLRFLWRDIVTAVVMLVLVTAPKPAASANGSISATAAANAAAAARAMADTMGTGAPVYKPAGLDSKYGDQPFNVEGQQMMDLTTSGLGINVGVLNGVANSGPTEALDVAGYVRVRSVNTEGGVILLDGAPATGFPNGQSIWVENNQGTFRLLDNGWDLQLFSVDQTGNVIVQGNVFSNGELQATKNLRLIGGSSGAIWSNDGTNTSLVLTTDGNPYSGFDATGAITGLTAVSVNDATGLFKMPSGLTIVSGGITYADGSVQTIASSFGGEYSLSTSGGTSTCTPNYKTGACSCPSSAPNAHQYINFAASGNTLAGYVCSND